MIDLGAKEMVSQHESHDVAVDDKMISSKVCKSILVHFRGGCSRGWCPNNPYVVGVTGGIAASGKIVREVQSTFGAAVFDCNKLGHQTYAKGSATLAAIVETLWEGILTRAGEVNRAALGPIVFGSKDAIEKLNQMSTPHGGTWAPWSTRGPTKELMLCQVDMGRREMLIGMHSCQTGISFRSELRWNDL